MTKLDATAQETAASVTLTIEEHAPVEEVVIGFRMDGTLYELSHMNPPVEATIKQK